jgi:hypothetical protein
MKKNLFIVVFLIITSAVCAQYARFGISAGVEMSEFATRWSFPAKISPKIGFRVAMEVDICVFDNFYLVPELVFTQRGTRLMTGNTEDIADSNGLFVGTITTNTQYTHNINSLQLPVNAMYKISVGENTMFCIFAGPYVAWNLSAKEKNHNKSYSEKLLIGYKKGEYKPIDLGFNFGVGLEYLDFFVRAQYNHGMTNLLNGEQFNYSRNRNAGVSVGFFF